MATEVDHISLANHNHELLKHLLKDVHRFPDWLATIASYKAVHVVEAVFAQDMSTHSTSHDERRKSLTIARFRGIHKDYKHLAEASRIARYLEDHGDEYTTFIDYMDAVTVVEKLIKKRLYGVEQKSLQFLSETAKSKLVKIDPSEFSTPSSA